MGKWSPGRYSRGKVRKKPIEVLTVPELLAVEKAASDWSVRDGALVRCMSRAGLRGGTVVGLCWGDVLEAGQIGRFLRVRSEIAKRGSGRQLPMDEELSKALRSWLASWVESGGQLAMDGLLFPGQRAHQAMTVRNVERIVARHAEQAIGRKIRPHLLRHTWASKLRKVTDIYTLQELLGHKNLSSTERYLHSTDADRQDAVRRAFQDVG